jgi:hypothetical protein
MTDLELAQQALPEPNITSVFGCQSWFENQLVSMYLAGMAKAREIAQPHLTSEQITAIYQQYGTGRLGGFTAAVRAIEAAHGIGKETP